MITINGDVEDVYLLQARLVELKLDSALFRSKCTKSEMNFHLVSSVNEVSQLAQDVSDTREDHVFG